MAASSPARSQMGEDHSDTDGRSSSLSVYSVATESEAGDGRGADDDDPCEAAFDRLPDEIIQQYARTTILSRPHLLISQPQTSRPPVDCC